jgi:hypothetical protein
MRSFGLRHVIFMLKALLPEWFEVHVRVPHEKNAPPP